MKRLYALVAWLNFTPLGFETVIWDSYEWFVYQVKFYSFGV